MTYPLIHKKQETMIHGVGFERLMGFHEWTKAGTLRFGQPPETSIGLLGLMVHSKY